jgi:hypothetical protein
MSDWFKAGRRYAPLSSIRVVQVVHVWSDGNENKFAAGSYEDNGKPWIRANEDPSPFDRYEEVQRIPVAGEIWAPRAARVNPGDYGPEYALPRQLRVCIREVGPKYVVWDNLRGDGETYPVKYASKIGLFTESFTREVG